MSSVAGWLVPRRTGTAQSDPVARFVGEAIAGDDRDSSAKPDRAAALFLRILDQADRDRELVFQRVASGIVPGHQAAGGAMLFLLQKLRPDCGLVGTLNLFQHTPAGIPESTKRAH